MSTFFFKRILLKLSGEALQGNANHGIDANVLNEYAAQIKEIAELGVETAIVIGGGNIFRGLQGVDKGYSRVRGDQMGMLATVINSLALQDALEKLNQSAATYSAIAMQPVCEHYSPAKVRRGLENGEVAIIAAGTGNPFFSTDTAAALRALEVGANVLLKGTRVDGVFSADPEKDPLAQKYDHITFSEVLKKGLRVMDLTAFTLCEENRLQIIVFDMNKKNNLQNLIKTGKGGTLVRN